MSTKTEKIENLLLSQIHSSTLNPRKVFEQDKLQELADSIKEKGLQQAIIVRPSGKDYEVIIGERRFRACQLLKLATIKAIVRDISDDEARIIMLIENLQREDLTPLEEGTMYEELVKLGVPLREIARRIGKKHNDVTDKYNIVKKLSDTVKDLLTIKSGATEPELEYSVAVEIADLPHKEQNILAKKSVEFGYTKEKVIEVKKLAEELEATIEKLPDDSFRQNLEKTYLPKKFDATTLPEVQLEILKEKGLWIQKPRFESELMPHMKRMQSFLESYPNNCIIIEWKGDASGVAKALAEFQKFLLQDKLFHWAFIVKF